MPTKDKIAQEKIKELARHLCECSYEPPTIDGAYKLVEAELHRALPELIEQERADEREQIAQLMFKMRYASPEKRAAAIRARGGKGE